MNNLSVRRYGILTRKPKVNVPTQTGIPVHKLVHNAMLDAANEAGLIPHDQPGDQQYHTFAKYRDKAHEELSNPDSPFTKMFYRHKAQLHTAPNPREHLKNALTPLFKYLAHGSKLPAIPAGNGGDSEPIDLLGGAHHPFEGDSGGFEYKPRLPSGFVAVPPPQPKRKPSPIRNDVYKSIAEHEDMGWSAPDKLKDYLVKKHGITPQEATTHIGNWRRKSKKPTAPSPTVTKRVWPPIQRKSRVDSTDLMAIPKKYMRVGDPHTHDAMMGGIVQKGDESGLGPFADFLQEQNAPGAALAREAHKNALEGTVHQPFHRGSFWPGADYDTVYPTWYRENGEEAPPRYAVDEGNIEVQPEISRPSSIGGYRTGLLSITHGPQTAEYNAVPTSPQLLQYHVPVQSRKHLSALTHDLPEPMRSRLWSIMAPHLREDHEQEAPTTPDTRPSPTQLRRQVNKPNRKYGRHQDFNNVAEAEPKELTHSGMYADALQEEGKDTHAAVVRGNASDYGDNGTYGLYSGGPIGHEGSSFTRIIPNGYDSWTKTMPTHYSIQLHINTGNGPHAYRTFGVHKGTPQEALQIVDGLQQEGATLEDNQKAYELLKQHAGQSGDEPVKMGGYRAPAGGAIVRGSQYKGGEMIPSMESKFMNPRRRLTRELSKKYKISC